MSEEKETHFMKRAQRKACWEAKELNQIKQNINRRRIYPILSYPHGILSTKL